MADPTFFFILRLYDTKHNAKISISNILNILLIISILNAQNLIVYDATPNKAKIPVRTASNHPYGFHFALYFLIQLHTFRLSWLYIH